MDNIPVVDLGSRDQDSTGRNLAGQDSVGQDSVGQDSAGQDSVGQDSVAHRGQEWRWPAVAVAGIMAHGISIADHADRIVATAA